MVTRERLDKRHEQVLGALIHAYITLAKPVGSSMLAHRYGLDVSPATVRNVMADLEQMGYLKRRHVSSGRIPTDAGYRYYVDILLDVDPLTFEEKQRIEAEYSLESDKLESILVRTCRRLAFESECAGVVKGPVARYRRLSQIDLVRLGPTRALVVLIDNLDTVHSWVVSLKEEMSRAQIEEITDLVNTLLNDDPCGGAHRSVAAQTKELCARLAGISQEAVEILDTMPMDEFDGKVYIEGARSVLDQPEFRDPAMTRAMLDVLTADDKLSRLLLGCTDGSAGVMFMIGSDAALTSVAEIGVVVAPYCISDRPVGTLGIIGPRRMRYSRAASLVDYTAEVLSGVLTDTFGPAWKEGSVN